MKKVYIFGLIGLACIFLSQAFAEEFTMSTYYPAPFGVYREFTTTSKTSLATNTLGTDVGEDLNSMVGIGTTNPQAKLHIAGTAGIDGIMFPDGTLQTSAAVEYYDIEDSTEGSAGAVRVRVWQRFINVQGGDYLLNVVANVGGTSVGDYWFGADTTDLGTGRIRYGISEAARNQQFNVTRIVNLSSGNHTLYFDALSEQAGDTSYIWDKYITLIRVQ